MALTVFEEGPVSLDPQKALFLPVGAASPLWFLFAGAASAGVAYWWMTRWADRTNLEALLAAPAPVEPDVPAPAADVVRPEPVVAVVESVEAAQAVVAQAVETSVETSVEVAAAVVETVEQVLSPEAEPAADAAPKTRTKIRPAGEPSSEA